MLGCCVIGWSTKDCRCPQVGQPWYGRETLLWPWCASKLVSVHLTGCHRERSRHHGCEPQLSTTRRRCYSRHARSRALLCPHRKSPALRRIAPTRSPKPPTCRASSAAACNLHLPAMRPGDSQRPALGFSTLEMDRHDVSVPLVVRKTKLTSLFYTLSCQTAVVLWEAGDMLSGCGVWLTRRRGRCGCGGCRCEEP